MKLTKSLTEFLDRVKRQKIKRRLKAAFRRTPRPARVIQDKEQTWQS